jgi:hypothetical protein
MPSRRTIVFGAILLFFVSLTGSAVVAAVAWNRIQESADRLVAVGDAMAAATLLLSAVGAMIALATYLASTESPQLEAEIVFRCSEPNRPVFLVEEEEHHRLRLVSFRQVEGSVRIHNRRSNSAHNPAIRVDLFGLGGIRTQPHWRPVDWANPYGVCAVQWDGGTQFAIHGNGTRVLPSLTLEGVVALPAESDHAMRVMLVADGFSKSWTMTVELRRRGDYTDYGQERAGRLAKELALAEPCGMPDCDRQAEIRVVMFPASGPPADRAVCSDCIDNHELFQTTPNVVIVDNLDMKHVLHDRTGRRVINGSVTRR